MIQPETSAMHVLLIDDEEILLECIAESLRSVGYRCDAYQCPVQALVAFQAKSFDAVVTDHQMPGLTGVDVAKSLKATRPEVPVILTSGTLRITDEEMKRIGVYRFIPKPFDAGALTTVLEGIRAMN